VASLTNVPTTRAIAVAAKRSAHTGRRALRDSVIVTIGGQLERALGTLTALALRWGLDPARLGVYTGLRLYLDNTNRSSLGVGLGAVQEIPILCATGQEARARHVANVAHTTNTITCLLFSLALIAWAWLRAPLVARDPLAAEWTWGLVATAVLALIKRYESFLIAVLRALQEFELTTKVDVVESLVSITSVSVGIWLAGFWGLLGAVGFILLAKIIYLHARHPLRFAWAWDPRLIWRLMIVGLPILANTAVFGAVLNLDRVLILWLVPDGDRAAGLYTIALMGTSWSLDVAGRIVTVLYTYFQSTLGRTGDILAVARQAAVASRAQAPLLAAGGAVAYVVGPWFLGSLMPRYVEGLPSLRPLLPGMVLLGLAWPARQMLITVGRPYRLAFATLACLAVAAAAGAFGAWHSGIIGVAWGMTVGYACVYLATSATAFVAPLGWRGWLSHELHLGGILCGITAPALIAAHVPLPFAGTLSVFVRSAILVALGAPILYHWARRFGWIDLLHAKRHPRPVAANSCVES
jgi:O-antigen/teichoic acid export membrane protein